MADNYKAYNALDIFITENKKRICYDVEYNK